MRDKLNTIRHMIVSHDKTAMKFFLGLVQCYASSFSNLSELAVPLQKLLKNSSNVKLEWGKEQDKAFKAFKAIKETFVSPAILKHYDPLIKGNTADRCK